MTHTPSNTLTPDHCLGDERRIFAFEADFADDLRCIPMVVRFKLDRVGVKLSLKQWTKIGAANRTAVLVQRCDTHREIADYRHSLIRRVTLHTSEPIVSLPLDADADWANPGSVPERLRSQALAAGLAPPALDQWARLSALERFALLKLARSNHDNDNFAPAMREFGLCARTCGAPAI